MGQVATSNGTKLNESLKTDERSVLRRLTAQVTMLGYMIHAFEGVLDGGAVFPGHDRLNSHKTIERGISEILDYASRRAVYLRVGPLYSSPSSGVQKFIRVQLSRLGQLRPIEEVATEIYERLKKLP